MAEKAGWKEFLSMLVEVKDPKFLSTVFDLFLTAEEKDNLALRFLIVRELLKQEKTQRQIAQDLNVSIAKITRGSNELKRMDAKLVQYLKDHITHL